MARGADRSPTVDHWTADIERLLGEVRDRRRRRRARPVDRFRQRPRRRSAGPTVRGRPILADGAGLADARVRGRVRLRACAVHEVRYGPAYQPCRPPDLQRPRRRHLHHDHRPRPAVRWVQQHRTVGDGSHRGDDHARRRGSLPCDRHIPATRGASRRPCNNQRARGARPTRTGDDLGARPGRRSEREPTRGNLLT